jgi:hypothetical protein
LGGKSKIGPREARAIAQKLDAEIEKHTGHDIAFIVFGGIEIARFGIRRGSNSGHRYIPKQLHISETEAMALSSCNMSKDAYFGKMKVEGYI